jgi:hypothetical protein
VLTLGDLNGDRRVDNVDLFRLITDLNRVIRGLSWNPKRSTLMTTRALDLIVGQRALDLRGYGALGNLSTQNYLSALTSSYRRS